MSKLFSLSFLLLLTSLFSWTACGDTQSESRKEQIEIAEVVDVHSCAKPGEAANKHLSLNLKVNFEEQILEGVATYDIVNKGAGKIWFDTRNLDIQRVTIDGEEETTFSLGEEAPFVGSPLEVVIKPNTVKVSIYYRTSPDAAALDWLSPQQTAGKRFPFLFTQGQAILTRSWIPIQDSPGIRITYDASITVPKEMMAVMSASNPQEKNDEGVYQFKMEQPIPPYLIALAVGDIAFQSVGERTGVYAEKPVIADAAYEFADMEKMLNTAETLYGPYLWDRYDLIVLPPSFPFGGMENPRLTFATPTILAGDRSLTSLVAHELAHSWSGNLVTNATWNDFWLNEGFTVYFERRIMEAVYGESYADMLAVLGYQDLEQEVNELGKDSKDTHLYLDLKGRDPDDGMTDIAYEKGAFFLKLIEEKVGREAFDKFLRGYFDTFRFQSMTTEKFLDHLQSMLIEPAKLEIPVKEWVYSPGVPSSCPVPKSVRFEDVDKQRSEYINMQDVNALQTKEWSTHEWLHFLRKLPKDTNPSTLSQLDEKFGFSASGNAEILAAWFELAIYGGYTREITPYLQKFLINIGRRKFLSPLYGALIKSGNTELAQQIFEKARPNYHSVSAGTIANMLNTQNKE